VHMGQNGPFRRSWRKNGPFWPRWAGMAPIPDLGWMKSCKPLAANTGRAEAKQKKQAGPREKRSCLLQEGSGSKGMLFAPFAGQIAGAIGKGRAPGRRGAVVCAVEQHIFPAAFVHQAGESPES